MRSTGSTARWRRSSIRPWRTSPSTSSSARDLRPTPSGWICPSFTLIGATTRAGQLSAPTAGPVWRDPAAGAVHPGGAGSRSSPARRASWMFPLSRTARWRSPGAAAARPASPTGMLRRVRDFAQVKAGGVITRRVADQALHGPGGGPSGAGRHRPADAHQHH